MDCFFSGSKAFFKTCANWKDIILINDETGKPYTKGYISKLVKKIVKEFQNCWNHKKN